ncbi:MAG: 2-dehydro-3-deoxy-6-phosphogalactonate aldolase [Rhodoferax sp.]
MKTVHSMLQHIRSMPLVAILRGLDPAQAPAVGEALLACGFGTLEVPLNRPGALEAIARLTAVLPAQVLVGGGTVLTPTDVDAVYAAGGRLIVAPNCDPLVIAHAVARGMVCAPGVATPSEAFAALRAGAHALKLFPAEMVGVAGLKAFKSVLPAQTELWPVGGVSPQSMAAWHAAGATGFGIGSQLYAPGAAAAEVLARGRMFVHAWQALGAAAGRCG